MKKWLAILLLLLFMHSHGNDRIALKLTGLNGQQAYLTSLSGDQLTLVDSTIANIEGVEFNLSNGSIIGVYRILFVHPEQLNERTRQIPYIEFIYNHENVILQSDIQRLREFPEIIESKENRVYYNFLENLARLENKLQLLKSVLDGYPKNERFYTQVQKEFKQVANDRMAYIDKMVLDFTGTYAAKLMRMHQMPVPNASLDEQAELNYLKAHFFDYINFYDPLLINSNAYTDKVIEYLSLYRQNATNQADQEAAFIEAVDNLIPEVEGNPEVYNFILNYLVTGFEKFGMDKVIDHIAVNYQAKECESGRPDIIQKRLEAFRKMAVGNAVPNFVIENHLGQTISLNSFDNQYKAIVFWSTQCPHCMNMMPLIDAWYKKNAPDKNVEVIAISIDTNAADWLNVIEKYRFDWHNYCSFNGWDDEVVQAYNIYATPTIFIVDRNDEIVAKPVEFNEFERFFE